MYESHFGLREAPFGITPDTSFFFKSPHSQEALNTLLVAARSGEGFINLVPFGTSSSNTVAPSGDSSSDSSGCSIATTL